MKADALQRTVQYLAAGLGALLLILLFGATRHLLGHILCWLALATFAALLIALALQRRQLVATLHQQHDERSQLLRNLDQRVRELSMLQQLARLLDDGAGPIDAPRLQALANAMPSGFRDGHAFHARVSYHGLIGRSSQTEATNTSRYSSFSYRTVGGNLLAIELAPVEDAPPFSPDERRILESAAELVRNNIERHESAHILAQRETLLSQLVEHAPVAIVIASGDPLRSRLINRRFTQLTGYTIENAPDIEALWAVLFPDFFYGDEIRAQWENHLADATRTNAAMVPVSAAITTHDRTTLQMELSTVVIGDHTILFWQDFTEIRSQAEALRRAQMDLEQRVLVRTLELQHTNHSLESEVRDRKRAEDRMRALTSALPDIAYSLDREARFEEVLSSVSPVPGTPPEVLQGRRLAEVLPAEIALALHQTAIQAIETRRTQHIEYQLSDHDTPRWFEGRAAPLVIDAGERHLAVFIVRNITERKQAEQTVRENEARLRAIFEASNTGFFFRDRAGHILYANDAYARLFGYTRSEIVGLDPSTFLAPTSAQAERTFLDEIKNSQRDGFRLEKQGVTKNGEKVWIDLSVAVVRDERGDALYQVGVAIDITARRLSEERLHATLAELERSNRDLEQFAYIASHDLQEPLRLVASYVQLLAQRYRQKLDTEADEFIAYAVDGAQRMQKLIQDLLAYSRVGRELHFAPVDCTRLVSDVCDNLKLAIQDAHATVETTPLPTVEGDPTMLAQLFQNLIANALKFHGEAPPHVRIDALHLPDEHQWRLSVQDNGIGIDPEAFDRIFVIFQRLHTRRKYPGSGIGLSICKKIVELHGGRIWVESAPDHGSTFLFTLPEASET